jgi:hypothetical protein
VVVCLDRRVRLLVARLRFRLRQACRGLPGFRTRASRAMISRNRASGLVVILMSLLLAAVCCTVGDTETPYPFPPWPTVLATPCEPPCWEGLVPGRTTREEASRILEQLPVVSSGPRGFTVVPQRSGPRVLGLYEGDVLQVMFGGVHSRYTLGQVVEQFGRPEGFYMFGGQVSARPRDISCEGWRPSDQPQGGAFPFDVLYPSRGLQFMVLRDFNAAGLICPEMRVVAFCYYAPVSMHEALTDNYLADLCRVNLRLDGVTEADLIEWRDFGAKW